MFPQIFGKYVLERELASGGMARVFLATLRGAGGFEKRLVVKQIRPELGSDQSFIQRFVAEAKTTVELSHSNIVPVYELGAEQGVYYIAMELCPGVSLAELLRDGPVSPNEGAYIGVEICRALDYAHRKAAIVHRDVTPRNVMIDAEGMVKVIDFGIAFPARSTASGALFGSPGHMAPEQLRPGPLTPAADVFAVAVLLIEAWTGRAPFRRESFAASADALREPPAPLGLTDPRLAALEPLIASALALAPDQRLQTAEELARPLREFLRQDDLGDLARRLGERVGQRLRGAAARTGPPLAGAAEPSAETGGSRSAELPTQTFAARPALFEWTAKIQSVPPEATGAMLEVTASPKGEAQGALESAAREASSIDSGITAPSGGGPDSGLVSRRRGVRRIAAAFLLGVVLLFGFGGRQWLRVPAPSAASDGWAASPASVAHDARAGAPAADAPELRASSALPTAPPFAPPPAAASLSDSRPVAGIPTSVMPARVASTAPTAGAPSRPAAARSALGSSEVPGAPRATSSALSARLQLTAEPPAWVEIDSTRVGRTPLAALPVAPGRHAIRFENPLLGERLEALVTLDPQGTARVHADFTSASPQVYVR